MSEQPEKDSVEDNITDAPAEGVVSEPSEPTADLGTSQEVSQPTSTSPTSDQKFTVTVGGEPIEVTLDEALNGYMRQADYTRKTQEVAAQREDLSYAERIAVALENDPAAAIQALMTAYDLQDQFVPQQPQARTPEPKIEELDPEEQRWQRVESFIQTAEERAFEAQVRAEFAEMHERFGDFDEQAVVQYALERGIPSVAEATKAFVVDSVLKTAERQQAERKAQARKETIPPVAGGHGVAGGSTQPGGTAAPRSIGEALALAERSLGTTL